MPLRTSPPTSGCTAKSPENVTFVPARIFTHAGEYSYSVNVMVTSVAPVWSSAMSAVHPLIPELDELELEVELDAPEVEAPEVDSDELPPDDPLVSSSPQPRAAVSAMNRAVNRGPRSRMKAPLSRRPRQGS